MSAKFPSNDRGSRGSIVRDKFEIKNSHPGIGDDDATKSCFADCWFNFKNFCSSTEVNHKDDDK